MTTYIMIDTPTDTGEVNHPRAVAKSNSRIEALMLAHQLEHGRPNDETAYLVDDDTLSFETNHRMAAAAFEANGANSADAAEVEILRRELAAAEDRGDLRRALVQKLVLADRGEHEMWFLSTFESVMRVHQTDPAIYAEVDAAIAEGQATVTEMLSRARSLKPRRRRTSA